MLGVVSALGKLLAVLLGDVLGAASMRTKHAAFPESLEMAFEPVNHHLGEPLAVQLGAF